MMEFFCHLLGSINGLFLSWISLILIRLWVFQLTNMLSVLSRQSWLRKCLMLKGNLLCLPLRVKSPVKLVQEKLHLFHQGRFALSVLPLML